MGDVRVDDEPQQNGASDEDEDWNKNLLYIIYTIIMIAHVTI